MCPFNNKICGGNATISLLNTGDNLKINIANATKGDACFYRVISKCGAPAFKANFSADYKVSYLEYDLETIASSKRMLAANSTNSTNTSNTNTSGKKLETLEQAIKSQPFKNAVFSIINAVNQTFNNNGNVNVTAVA